MRCFYHRHADFTIITLLLTLIFHCHNMFYDFNAAFINLALFFYYSTLVFYHFPAYLLSLRLGFLSKSHCYAAIMTFPQILLLSRGFYHLHAVFIIVLLLLPSSHCFYQCDAFFLSSPRFFYHYHTIFSLYTDFFITTLLLTWWQIIVINYVDQGEI